MTIGNKTLKFLFFLVARSVSGWLAPLPLTETYIRGVLLPPEVTQLTRFIPNVDAEADLEFFAFGLIYWVFRNRRDIRDIIKGTRNFTHLGLFKNPQFHIRENLI